ncbi:AAA family ATPase [Mitsuaria sp. TWR114]|uniref:KAP family P-loop NTPase fold protein n=1 Tax=Mitsuaria sp. TWR114 TaxID=2601731 RepID=UPI0011BF606F|nr:P-loop NTPase fold protein [Mitsuaria sp. TWR114]TXD80751.1 AAA family ATPase [Mitsuaria sp. TWR114]
MSKSQVFGQDELQRKPFAERVIRFAIGLCDQEVLPAGRVLAIDAPWGSGKSWVATRLVEQLRLESEVTPIYINAFEFDFHHDPFSVLLSAILDATKGNGQKCGVIEGLRTAGAAVLSAASPKAVVALAAAAGSTLIPGSGALVESISEALGDASKDALKIYSEVKKTSDAFRKELGKVAKDSKNRIIIVIDELDRCRPTFALEMLERIKHLFDVQNLVFVLAVHKPALESAIQHTYGNGIVPSLYLRKFISLEVALPNSLGRGRSLEDRARYYREFINARFGAANNDVDLLLPLVELAPYFDATLRDLEYVILLSKLAPNAMHRGFSAVYALLLWMFDRESFEQIRQGRSETFQAEYQRFAKHGNSHGNVGTLLVRALASHVSGINKTSEDLEIIKDVRLSCRDLDLGSLRI